MKTSRWKRIYLVIAVLAIILVAGGYQLPQYASRLTVIAALALIDMLYWMPVQRDFGRHKSILSIVYWLPLTLLLLFFITGYFIPYQNWHPFLRIYFPGVLLIVLIGKGIFLSCMLLGEIIFFLPNLYHRFTNSKTSRRKNWKHPPVFMNLGAIISGIVMMVFISGMFFWVNGLKMNTVKIPVKNLPEAFEDYRIVQVSDLHLGSFLNEKPLKRIVELTNSLHPDALLFTGDLVNFTTGEALPFEKLMKRFSAKDGKFAILGNHDYGEYSQWNSPAEKHQNDSALFDFYKRTGWRLLRNENVIIRRDSASMAIIGVENWSIIKRFGKKGNLKRAISGAESSQFKILMSHDPTHWAGEVTHKFPGINLTLSGHTHAFQIAIETGTFKWSPASMLFDQWGGLYEQINEAGTKQFLYVNRGAGTLGYPGRIGTWPEVTLILLHRVD